MHLTCLDLEGVLIPEIWIGLSQMTGIEELSLTTRDNKDYNALMKHRLAVCEKLSPFKGAQDFTVMAATAL